MKSPRYLQKTGITKLICIAEKSNIASGSTTAASSKLELSTTWTAKSEKACSVLELHSSQTETPLKSPAQAKSQLVSCCAYEGEASV